MPVTGTKEALENSVGGAYWTGEQHLIKTVPHWTILRMNYYAESMAEEIQMPLAMNVLAGLGDERVRMYHGTIWLPPLLACSLGTDMPARSTTAQDRPS